MKGIWFDGKNASYREDLKMPIPEKNESLVRILMAAVCNTDKEIMRGYRPDFQGVMGHEFVGVVEQSPKKELIGKMVVGELNATCGECIYCKTGRYTHCNARRVLGMHDKDGCFAEYMTIDTSLLFEVPEGTEVDHAIYTEPLAAAYEILTQIAPAKDMPIAVLGDGRLAYCITQAFHEQGYRVTVIGKHPEKLALFAPYADTTTQKDTEAYEVVIEATGSESGMRDALSLVRKKGTIVLKSTYAGEVSLPLSQVAVNEITIVGSRCGPFAPAVDAIAGNRVSFPEISLYELKDFEAAFTDRSFKAGFSFE